MKAPLIILSAGLFLAPSLTLANEKVIAGWSEAVLLFPGKVTVSAKLDTGARTSSLHVPKFKKFRRDGQDWIEFNFRGKLGGAVKVTRPIVRVARVKDLTGPSQNRPVIMLGVCLGTVYRETQVTLFDRSGFNFRMLLGRRFLDGQVVVDVSKRRMTTPNCPNAPTK